MMATSSDVRNQIVWIAPRDTSFDCVCEACRRLGYTTRLHATIARSVEQRHDKRPILSDLRESGSIEQDADLVMFIYRDEYYNEESDQQGIAEVHLAKHRNGPTDTVKLSFLKRYAKFADLAAA